MTNAITTLFVGYDIPMALDVKHEEVLPELDKVFTRIDLDGDIAHLVPEKEINKAQDIIDGFNEKYRKENTQDDEDSFNLTCDFEDYRPQNSTMDLNVDIELSIIEHSVTPESKDIEEIDRLVKEKLLLLGYSDIIDEVVRNYQFDKPLNFDDIAISKRYVIKDSSSVKKSLRLKEIEVVSKRKPESPMDTMHSVEVLVLEGRNKNKKFWLAPSLFKLKEDK